MNTILILVIFYISIKILTEKKFINLSNKKIIISISIIAGIYFLDNRNVINLLDDYDDKTKLILFLGIILILITYNDDIVEKMNIDKKCKIYDQRNLDKSCRCLVDPSFRGKLGLNYNYDDCNINGCDTMDGFNQSMLGKCFRNEDDINLCKKSLMENNSCFINNNSNNKSNNSNNSNNNSNNSNNNSNKSNNMTGGCHGTEYGCCDDNFNQCKDKNCSNCSDSEENKHINCNSYAYGSNGGKWQLINPKNVKCNYVNNDTFLDQNNEIIPECNILEKKIRNNVKNHCDNKDCEIEEYNSNIKNHRCFEKS